MLWSRAAASAFAVQPTFWNDFWPNFAATVAGTVIGIPIALFLYGKQSRDERKSRERELGLRRSTVAALLRDVVGANSEELRRVAAVLEDNGVATDLRLRMEIWQVVRPEVLEIFSASLRAELAAHFEAVSVVQLDVHEQAKRQLEALWAPSTYDDARVELIRGIERTISAEAVARALDEAARADNLCIQLRLLVDEAD